MEKTSVVVTGLGLVTPVGVGMTPFWRNVTNGISGINPITPYDPVLEPIKYAGESETPCGRSSGEKPTSWSLAVPTPASSGNV